jgi:NAD(P)-dependent dehydrogenase (short-subunit alcohol dehydrogenase family)
VSASATRSTLAAGIRDQGGTALVVQPDVTDQQQAAGAVERTAAELGRLNTLVNNAGVMLPGPAVGAPLQEWQQMVELNVPGLLYCANAALPHLLPAAADDPRRVADMVNISSAVGRVARNGSGVYTLTKRGPWASQGPSQGVRGSDEAAYCPAGAAPTGTVCPVVSNSGVGVRRAGDMPPGQRRPRALPVSLQRRAERSRPA